MASLGEPATETVFEGQLTPLGFLLYDDAIP